MQQATEKQMELEATVDHTRREAHKGVEGPERGLRMRMRSPIVQRRFLPMAQVSQLTTARTWYSCCACIGPMAV